MLYKFKLINPEQSGFKANNLTELALISFIVTIKRDNDSGVYFCHIFVKLQLPFDIVDHETLLAKLSFYGIRKLERKWFSYFINKGNNFYLSRTFYETQESFNVACLYINDLAYAFKNYTIHHFADDTSPLYGNSIIKNPTYLFPVLQRNITTLSPTLILKTLFQNQLNQ